MTTKRLNLNIETNADSAANEMRRLSSEIDRVGDEALQSSNSLNRMNTSAGNSRGRMSNLASSVDNVATRTQRFSSRTAQAGAALSLLGARAGGADSSLSRLAGRIGDVGDATELLSIGLTGNALGTGTAGLGGALAIGAGAATAMFAAIGGGIATLVHVTNATSDFEDILQSTNSTMRNSLSLFDQLSNAMTVTSLDAQLEQARSPNVGPVNEAISLLTSGVSSGARFGEDFFFEQYNEEGLSAVIEQGEIARQRRRQRLLDSVPGSTEFIRNQRILSRQNEGLIILYEERRRIEEENAIAEIELIEENNRLRRSVSVSRISNDEDVNNQIEQEARRHAEEMASNLQRQAEMMARIEERRLEKIKEQAQISAQIQEESRIREEEILEARLEKIKENAILEAEAEAEAQDLIQARIQEKLQQRQEAISNQLGTIKSSLTDAYTSIIEVTSQNIFNPNEQDGKEYTDYIREITADALTAISRAAVAEGFINSVNPATTSIGIAQIAAGTAGLAVASAISPRGSSGVSAADPRPSSGGERPSRTVPQTSVVNNFGVVGDPTGTARQIADLLNDATASGAIQIER